MPLPRLSGIIVENASRIAIFTDPSGGGSWVVREGERVGVFTVTAIGPGEAHLAGPLGSYVVQPSAHRSTRTLWLWQAPVMPLIDPVYRETMTETDQ